MFMVVIDHLYTQSFTIATITYICVICKITIGREELITETKTPIAVLAPVLFPDLFDNVCNRNIDKKASMIK
jgi:hypothetical protein